ncbi:PDC sensor domain-containing protein, partial [Helicobacter mesocricetorum]|uniref:PDC sensor domain-containing protein n=1 Tax=Helicobacter mesocricetorum TaxID=87012 RepID=UPI000CF13818
MLKHLKIGTKITIIISLVFILCLGTLSIIISITSSNIQAKSSKNLLEMISEDASKTSLIVFNEVYTALANSHGRIQSLIQGSSNDKLKFLVENIANTLDNNNWGAYSYIYLKDANIIGGDNYINPEYKLNDGGLILLAKDNNIQNPGGIVIMRADDTITNFGSVQKALTTGRISMGNPSMQTFAGDTPRLGIAINFPLKDTQNVTQGVVGIFIDLSELSEELNNSRYSFFTDDYRILLSEDLTIGSHPNPDILAKNLMNVIHKKNDDTIINAIKNHQNGVFPFIDYKGEDTFAAITSFEIGYGTGIFWTAVALAPLHSIYANVYELNYIILGCSIIILLILIVVLFLYVHKNITTRITNLSEHLLKFFKALQYKGEYPPNLKPKHNDEFGQ